MLSINIYQGDHGEIKNNFYPYQFLKMYYNLLFFLKVKSALFYKYS
jgi:hypothetical protein